MCTVQHPHLTGVETEAQRGEENHGDPHEVRGQSRDLRPGVWTPVSVFPDIEPWSRTHPHAEPGKREESKLLSFGSEVLVPASRGQGNAV